MFEMQHEYAIISSAGWPGDVTECRGAKPSQLGVSAQLSIGDIRARESESSEEQPDDEETMSSTHLSVSVLPPSRADGHSQRHGWVAVVIKVPEGKRLVIGLIKKR